MGCVSKPDKHVMNDESPFASFVPSGEAPTAPEKTKKKRGKKASALPAAQPVSAKPKKERKPRVAKQPREMKIGLQAALIAVAGLSADDCHVVDKAAAIISGGSKKSRQRIVAALGKIFA